jgi:hypothetical protein
MHENQPSYRLMLRQRPSWLTQETMLGATLPLALSPVVAAGIGVLAPSIMALSAVGMVVGGFVGRQRIKRENEEGRIVQPPTHFNKLLIAGLAVGIAAAAGVGLLATAITYSGLAFFTAKAAAIAGWAYTAGAITCIGGAGYLGASYGKRLMAAEHEFASHSGIPVDHNGRTITPKKPAEALEAPAASIGGKSMPPGEPSPTKQFAQAEMQRREQTNSALQAGRHP